MGQPDHFGEALNADVRALLRPLKAGLHVVKVRAQCIAADVRDTRERRAGRWPPALARFRVHGACDLASYRAVGERCAADVIAAFRAAGLDPHTLRRVLDFGAGCGRTLRFLMPQLPTISFDACDVDGAAVKWGRELEPGASWQHTAALPPLPFADESFDALYAISVFTHLDEQRQFLWLDELRRVLRRGGTMLLTVQPAEEGFVLEANHWKGFHPDWYQDSRHSESYVKRAFTRELTLAGFLPRGMNGHQDVVLLRRPD